MAPVTSPAPPSASRPSQTTMAGGLVIAGSVFLVFLIIDSATRLRSIETREGIEEMLGSSQFEGMGMSVENVIDILHFASIVAALCAVASATLGWQALRGSRNARLTLSIIAVPMVLCGLPSGGFIATLVAVAVVMLWLSPSREWFAGVTPPTSRHEAVSAGAPARSHPAWPPTSTPGQASPTATLTSAPPLSAGTRPRPEAATLAIALTVIVASLVGMVALLSVVMLALNPDLLLGELHRQNPEFAQQGYSDATLKTMGLVSGGVVVIWSAVAVLLAGFAAARRRWAARALMVCAVLCAAFCLLAAIGSIVTIVPAVCAVVTVVKLRRPEVRAWYDARG